jgi:hypothetical protein
MSGVFNIVDSLRGGGHVAPIRTARSAIYALFNKRHGRPAIGEECDRLDVALDGLLKSNVGFEHVIDEVDTWHNTNFVFDDDQAAAITQAEYGIDAAIIAQSQSQSQRQSPSSSTGGGMDAEAADAEAVEMWVERAYRLAMGNRGEGDIAWMADRYAKEARPRGTAIDIAAGRPALGPPHAAITTRLPNREVRSADSRMATRTIHFSDINPTINRPDPMASAPPNL